MVVCMKKMKHCISNHASGRCFRKFTCPTIGFLQAPQTPLATVWTPSLLRSDCRLPSMLSSLLDGLGGPVGETFPWDWIWWRKKTGPERLQYIQKQKGSEKINSFLSYQSIFTQPSQVKHLLRNHLLESTN